MIAAWIKLGNLTLAFGPKNAPSRFGALTWPGQTKPENPMLREDVPCADCGLLWNVDVP